MRCLKLQTDWENEGCVQKWKMKLIFILSQPTLSLYLSCVKVRLCLFKGKLELFLPRSGPFEVASTMHCKLVHCPYLWISEGVGSSIYQYKRRCVECKEANFIPPSYQRQWMAGTVRLTSWFPKDGHFHTFTPRETVTITWIEWYPTVNLPNAPRLVEFWKNHPPSLRSIYLQLAPVISSF